MSNINDNHMMYGSWDKERDGQDFLTFWAIFRPFTFPAAQKIEILKKWKKHLEILSFYGSVPKMKIIWCMVPEIWSVIEFFVILDLLLPFLLLTTQKIKILKKWKKTPWDIIILHMYTIKDNHMIYGSWIIKHNTEFFVILSYFLHFYPPNNPKNQNLEKMKKNPWRYHHFTIVYQKSWSYTILFLRYGVTDVIVFHFGPFFCPFTP